MVEVIGWIILVMGIIGAAFSLVNDYAKRKIREERSYAGRAYEKEILREKKKGVAKTKLIAMGMLLLGLVLILM